jgi:transcription termination factor Rho
MDRSTLGSKALSELREIASAMDLSGYARMKKADLVDLIIEAGQATSGADDSTSDDTSDDTSDGKVNGKGDG